MDLVPIIVRIGLNAAGGHEYPEFNKIDSSLRGGTDWSIYIERFGGWRYDKVAGHHDEDSSNDSPSGTWLGMLTVPAEFAREAIRIFPSKVSAKTDAQAKAFYENRSTVKQPAEIRDEGVLQALANKKALGKTLTADDKDAIDPTKPQAGLRTNPEKTWTQYKTKRNIKTVAP